jgi:hypothetical protein
VVDHITSFFVQGSSCSTTTSAVALFLLGMDFGREHQNCTSGSELKSLAGNGGNLDTHASIFCQKETDNNTISERCNNALFHVTHIWFVIMVVVHDPTHHYHVSILQIPPPIKQLISIEAKSLLL